jgi:thioesterase III
MSTHQFQLQISQAHLDDFHHVNNAQYLSLFEAARWNLITQNGYGIDKIQLTGLGPVILELKVQFLKELNLGDLITIETQLISYESKVAQLKQIIKRKKEICTEAEFKFGLFDLKKRKLVQPTQEWLIAINAPGINK